VKAKLKIYFPIIFLTLVVLISVSLLVGIDSITSDKIADQEEQKVQTRLAEMFPDMDKSTEEEIDSPDDKLYTIYDDAEEVIGYAFEAKGKGYGGDIKILVGLEDETTIKEADSTNTTNQDEVLNEAREFFEVSSDCKDLSEINKKYKQLSKTLHPDTDTGDEEKFKELNEAHKVLKRELE